MRGYLNLTVEPTLGIDIDDAVADACELAAKLGLHCVTLTANDFHYNCYPDWRAYRFRPVEDMYGFDRWVVEGPTRRREWRHSDGQLTRE